MKINSIVAKRVLQDLVLVGAYGDLNHVSLLR